MKKAILFVMSALLVFPALCRAQEFSPRTAIVYEIKGEVQVKTGAESWKSASAGMVLNESDEVKTGGDGKAVLLLDPDAETGKLELSPNSHLKLSTMQRTPGDAEEKVTVLDLALGKVLVRAEKLKKDSKFEVRTPTATTGVQGTVFEVSVDKE